MEVEIGATSVVVVGWCSLAGQLKKGFYRRRRVCVECYRLEDLIRLLARGCCLWSAETFDQGLELELVKFVRVIKAK